MIGWLRALERMTRPPRMGHDVDVPVGNRTRRKPGPPRPRQMSEAESLENYQRLLDGAEQLAERESDRDSWEPNELVPPPSNLDDVVVLLAHLDCCVEDIRNLIQNSFAGAAASLADGDLSPSGGVSSPFGPPSVREDKQQDASSLGLACVSPAGPQPNSPPAGLTTNAGDAPAGVDADPPTRPPAGPDLATWLEPAVCEVLAEHVPSPDRGNDPAVICHDSTSHRRYLDDWQAWREHVAPLIAAHIVKALAAQPK